MWKTVKLGDLIDLQNGYAFKSKDYSSDGYFVMRITNVQRGYISNHNPRYIQIKSNSNLQKFILKEQDILISLTGDVGRVGIIKEDHLPCVLNQRVAKINVINESLINKNFLFLYLNSEIFIKKVEKLSHGAAQANVATKDILNIKFNLPTLTEQLSLTSKLDIASKEIDMSIYNVEKKEKEIEVLLDKIIKSEFSDDGRKKSIAFSKICTLQRGFDLPKSQRKPGKFPLFSANGVTDYIDSFKVSAPGVVTGRSGTIGQVHYSQDNFWALNTSLYVKDFMGNYPKYIYYFLKSFDLKKYASGAGVPTLNRNVLSDRVAFIETDYEKQIIKSEKLDKIYTNAANIKFAAEAQRKNYEALKSSIFRKELQGVIE